LTHTQQRPTTAVRCDRHKQNIFVGGNNDYNESEINLKFTEEMPEAKPAPNKKVEIQLTDQNGIVFTAFINAKSWRKAEASAAEFETWAGMVSGKLGKTDNGFEVLDAGVQIFEKRRRNQSQCKRKQQLPSATAICNFI
jgi:hypothetical protein